MLREEGWLRIGEVVFLTVEEKREVVGFGRGRLGISRSPLSRFGEGPR